MVKVRGRIALGLGQICAELPKGSGEASTEVPPKFDQDCPSLVVSPVFWGRCGLSPTLLGIFFGLITLQPLMLGKEKKRNSNNTSSNNLVTLSLFDAKLLQLTHPKPAGVFSRMF